MNTDPEFKNLFKSWKTQVELPVRFRSEVWRKIEEEKEIRANSLWAQLSALVTAAFARPQYAIAFLTLFIGVGSFLGVRQGENYLSNMQAKYIQSIDPVAQAFQRNIP